MNNGDAQHSLGGYIKARRLSAGLSVADAADATDLDRSYWHRLEGDYYKTPAPQHLSAIADVLRVPLADLYELAGYDIPDRLPSLQPYLRSKYNLPPEAVADIERYFELLRNYYGIPKDQPVFPPKPKGEIANEAEEVEAA